MSDDKRYYYLRKCILAFFQGAEYRNMKKFLKTAEINDWFYLGMLTTESIKIIKDK